jgi:hypothetical protein
MAFVLRMLTEALPIETTLTQKCWAETRRASGGLVTARELVLDGTGSEHEARMLLGSFVLGGAEWQRVR